ncbi:papilin isoform X1 [Drosophila willistoni]|uniref:papilin isoform X1 n=1 Tax=Drosophila willistoni TaxID=7260 RepID=UPI001F08631A|nr:papilin isoform X1 [Drosophila willistoni]
MANFLTKCSIYFVFMAVICTHLVHSDLSTIERIKKHEEWLKQHSKPKTDKSKTNIKPKTTLEFANLWRPQKNIASKQKSRNNEVFSEYEKPTATSEATNSALSGLKSTTMSLNAKTTNIPISTEEPLKSTNLSLANDIILSSINNTSHSVTTESSTTLAMPTVTQEPLTTSTLVATTTKKTKIKVRPYPRWANWNEWSECSRSCGGGIRHQIRKCINRNFSTGKRFTSNACVGLYKRYELCNDIPCPPESQDFRAKQCSAYNDIDFQGQRYKWEPYIKDDTECELNCMPSGMKYFATLNDTVIDGTSCYRPAEYYRSNYLSRAMCVDGICKAVQASGAINGLYANSGSVSCGGLLCRPVTGIFTRDPLPEDAYVHVATIPAGASNISITELKNSINLLVLRTSDQKCIFNGENEISESASYEAVGSTFDYHRIDGVQHGDGVTEWITSTGPIREPLELLIYSKTLNPGVKYEYLLPIVSDSEENELSLESSDGFLRSGNEDAGSSSSIRTGRRRKYHWKVIGFSSCTKSCGGGTQVPMVRCARENPVRYYSQRRCLHAEKPVLNENLLHCNTQPCPAYWRVDDWGECRCQHGEAFRRRELSCVQELASGIVIHVDKAACLEEQPPTQKQCECPKARRRNPGRYRFQLDANGTRSQRYKADKGATSATWLMSEWNQQCSASCGAGIEYRTIFCDRSKLSTERCDPRDTPDNRRPCEQSACKVGDWFAGPWSSCNGDCFNLTRSRVILCIQNQLITDEEDCKPELKPQLMEKCSHDEIPYCAPRWHYSEWSECSKPCNGTQRRSVKCLEYDNKQNILRDSNKCRYALREPIFRSCNTEKCEEFNEELPQNDASPVCVDQFSNCQWAVNAKLCGHDYYRNNCCASCKAGR